MGTVVAVSTNRIAVVASAGRLGLGLVGGGEWEGTGYECTSTRLAVSDEVVFPCQLIRRWKGVSL